MGRSRSGVRKQKKPEAAKPSISLLDAACIMFQVDGEIYSVEDAPDLIFDQWIRKHVVVAWSLPDRVDAINTALATGKTMFVQAEAVTPESAAQAAEAS